MTDAAPQKPRKKASPFRRRQRRILLLGIVLPAFAGATAVALVALSKTQVYFYAPSSMPPVAELEGREVRLGGLVEVGTLLPGVDDSVTFTVSDGEATIPVLFRGTLPSLVAEGDGVVAQGVMQEDGTFLANNVLARHDENYMAPEVADALKETGAYDQYIEDRRQ